MNTLANTLAECWEDFKNRVIPSDAGSIQIEEMQKAFYSGAISHINIMHNMPELSDDDAITYMENLYKECENFFSSVVINNSVDNIMH